nr:unnamed protein product [Digitaria exilis]
MFIAGEEASQASPTRRCSPCSPSSPLRRRSGEVETTTPPVRAPPYMRSATRAYRARAFDYGEALPRARAPGVPQRPAAQASYSSSSSDVQEYTPKAEPVKENVEVHKTMDEISDDLFDLGVAQGKIREEINKIKKKAKRTKCLAIELGKAQQANKVLVEKVGELEGTHRQMAIQLATVHLKVEEPEAKTSALLEATQKEKAAQKGVLGLAQLLASWPAIHARWEHRLRSKLLISCSATAQATPHADTAGDARNGREAQGATAVRARALR